MQINAPIAIRSWDYGCVPLRMRNTTLSDGNLGHLNRWPLSVDEMAQSSDHLRKLLRGELLEVVVAVFIMVILFCLAISVGLFFAYI